MATSAPDTAQAPAQQSQQVAALPFPIASRVANRFSFNAGTVTLSAAQPTPVSPIQVPAVGFLSYLNLEVTVTGTGGTTPAFTPDAPFNVIQSLAFKTAAGNDIIAPYTGYQLYLANKWGCQFSVAPQSDNRVGRQYSATAPSAHFFLQVPLNIDPKTALGDIPALASNRNYQLNMTYAAISSLVSGGPNVTVSITGTAYYRTEPPATTQQGIPQQTKPDGLGTLSKWAIEMPAVTPGDKYIPVHAVGNVLRTVIFCLRDASGARIDANGWPAVSEVYLDNEQMFRWTQNEWEDFMCKRYGFDAASKDVAKGLDTGVYVLPYHALFGRAGEPANTRTQLLPTLDSESFEIRGVSFGSAASTLEVLTQSIIPISAAALYAK